MRKIFRILGILMLLFGIGFIIFALNNSQMSFPWNNEITYMIYSAYLIINILFLCLPIKK